MAETLKTQATAEKKPQQQNAQRESWLTRKLNQLGNNVRLIDLYARQKDYYKLFEMIGPVLGTIVPWNRLKGNRPKDVLGPEIKQIKDSFQSLGNYLEGLDPAKPLNKEAGEKIYAHLKSIQDFNTAKDKAEPQLALQRLNNNLWGDTLNFLLNSGISKFSSWWEKGMVVRTYEDLVRQEFNINDAVTFKDIKRSKNPIVQEAARYYSRKAVIRSVPDFTGLIRWIPKVAYMIKPELALQKSSGFGKFLHTIAENLDGMKILLGSKTLFFSWYFFERQTGSFYEAENLWNKTEGIKNLPNRGLNQNVLPGEFVRWQEIRTLYERFREEQPSMGLSEFTTHDPLTTRVFEQAARYLNYTYMRPIFEMVEQGKQQDLEGKRFTHAMLLDLMGNGGLRVEDAIGSAIRLEIMAHYGMSQTSLAMQKFREAEQMLQKIKRPKLTDYATPDEGVEALYTYFKRMESVAEQFLGDTWPSSYFEQVIKPGYINYYFGGKPPLDKLDYLMSAIAVSDAPLENVMAQAPAPAPAPRFDEAGPAPTDSQTDTLAIPPSSSNSWANRSVPATQAVRKTERAASFTELASHNAVPNSALAGGV